MVDDANQALEAVKADFKEYKAAAADKKEELKQEVSISFTVV